MKKGEGRRNNEEGRRKKDDGREGKRTADLDPAQNISKTLAPGSPLPCARSAWCTACGARRIAAHHCSRCPLPPCPLLRPRRRCGYGAWSSYSPPLHTPTTTKRKKRKMRKRKRKRKRKKKKKKKKNKKKKKKTQKKREWQEGDERRVVRRRWKGSLTS